jgi:hypothetical protein
LTRLLGPRQDKAAPPCGLRLRIRQSFLTGGPGSLAAAVERIVEAQLAGFERWPLGEFREVGRLDLWWSDSRLPPHVYRIRAAAERSARAAAPPGPRPGTLRGELVLDFEDGQVPLAFAVAPSLRGSALALETSVRAAVDTDSRIAQVVSDLFDGDDLATAIARRELQAIIGGAFAVPPPIELGDGHRLVLGYCPGAEISMLDRGEAVVPLAVLLPAGAAEAPVDLATPAAPPPDGSAPISIEADADAVNGLLHALWASGYLDHELAAAGVVDRFNRDELVRSLLSVRIAGLALPLPPTVEPAAGGFQLAAEAALVLEDGGRRTPARLFGRVGFALAPGPPPGPGLAATVLLADLALTCEPAPGRLTPCYADLAAAARDRAADLHGAVADRLAHHFDLMWRGRAIASPDGSLAFTVDRAEADGAGGWVRIQLFGGLR